MKNRFVLLLCALVTVFSFSVSTVLAQESKEEVVKSKRKLPSHPDRKGFYFNVGVGGGISNLSYELMKGSLSLMPGYTANLGFTYFFTPSVGIGTGAYIGSYGAIASLNSSISYANVSAPTFNPAGAPSKYTHNVTFAETWREQQSVTYVEIPLALHFQKTMAGLGVYGAIGAKYGLPIDNSWKVLGGEINNKANETLNLGNLHSANQRGTLEFKNNVSAFVEIGALIQLTQRVDLMVGAYVNYGFSNILDYESSYKKDANGNNIEGKYGIIEKNELGFNGKEYPTGGYPYVQFMRDYESVVKTNVTGDRMSLVQAGVKLQLNIYVGPEKIKKNTADTLYVTESIVKNDTIYKKDVDTVYVSSFGTVISSNSALKNGGGKSYGIHNALAAGVIWFDFNSYEPKLHPSNIIDMIAEGLIANPNLQVAINGHACRTGKPEVNKKIALVRAQVIEKMLLQKGVKKEQLLVRSYSSDVPYTYNSYSHQYSKDRRVEIIPLGFIE